MAKNYRTELQKLQQRILDTVTDWPEEDDLCESGKIDFLSDLYLPSVSQNHSYVIELTPRQFSDDVTDIERHLDYEPASENFDVKVLKSSQNKVAIPRPKSGGKAEYEAFVELVHKTVKTYRDLIDHNGDRIQAKFYKEIGIENPSKTYEHTIIVRIETNDLPDFTDYLHEIKANIHMDYPNSSEVIIKPVVL